MSQSDRAIKKLATQLARLDREVKSWRGAQADYTSIENGGNFTFKDGDGNVTAIMGGQDDGSNTIRHVDGPVPPIPSGLTAHVDGPIVQVSWDGTFEDADEATYDWSHLEVVAVGPSNEQLTATINDVTGATANLAATVSGEWTVVARSVSRAEKRSLDGDAGTVDVELVGLTGAINDAIGSANGKNTVTYAEVPPTPADEGIVGDTWWVGQVGRPNDIVEATNLVFNPSFEVAPSGLSLSSGLAGAVQSTDSRGILSGAHCLSVTGASSGISVNSAQIAVYTSPGISAGEYLGWGWSLLDANAVGLTVSVGVNWYTSGGSFVSSEYQSYRTVPTSLDVMSSAFLAPTGAYRARMIIRFRASDGSSAAPANFNVLTDGWLASPAVSESAALAAVATYFDGDTTDGATDDEPHYRWTGTPHASTSEKYLPAIPDSGSDAWNITEQWQYTSAGWKPVEVSHEVIATVDLGKATVGELDGVRIMGKTVRGEQLSGDAIDGKVITGATYRTSGGNGSWSDAGLFISQPDGTSMVRFPTDGSPLSLTASDTQIERASIGELDVANGAVRSGGLLELSSGVTPPAAPPELNAAWKRVTTLPAVDSGVSVNGFTAWGDKWLRALNVRGAAEGDRIEIYNNSGELEQQIPLSMNPHFGVTVLGNVCYVLGHQHGRPLDEKRVHGYDLVTGERVTNWVFTRFGSTRQKKLEMGNDGTNIIVAGTHASNYQVYVMRYNPDTGAQVGGDLVGDFGINYSADVHGVTMADGRLYVSAKVEVREYAVSGDSLVLQGMAWTNPNRDGAGFVFVDDRPFVVDGSGVVFEGSTRASDYSAEVCFTWYDGTHETTPSPVATINVAARETVTISLPHREGLGKRVYYRGAGGTNWARANVAENVTSTPLPAGVATFQPPASNSFPNADPATLKSTNDKFEVRGDGSGRWGPLAFHADGSMTGLPIAAGTVVNGQIDGPGNNVFTVNLPPGKFSSPPVVTYTTASPRISPAVDEITATSFRVRLYNLTSAVAPDTTIQWIAVGI